MSGPALRLANVTDAQFIALMSRELIEAGLSGWSWDPPRVARSIQARDTIVVIAAVDRQPTGFAIMNFGDESAHLSLLAVEPSHRRLGVGRGLFDWLKKSALTAGIAVIKLELRAGNAPSEAEVQRIWQGQLSSAAELWKRNHKESGGKAADM